MFSVPSLSDRNRGSLRTRLHRFLVHYYRILVPCAFFLLDWAGIRAHWRHYSHLPLFGPPRHLADIWWHLPAMLALSFVVDLPSPSRRARREAFNDAHADKNDADKPITLGL
jgi:hypothetical protein